MLKKINRLKKNKHFNYIYKNGTTVFGKIMNMVYIKTKVKPFKIGFSVSNKIGKAHDRNKIKRRMRESFKSLIKFVDRRYNYIFVAKTGIEMFDFNDIKQNMLELIKKASLLNEDSNKNNT